MESASDLPLIGTVLQIFLANILLSGDNAVFITLVSHSMPVRLRRTAFLIGTVFAIVARVVVTACAAFLLRVPALKLVAGLVLLVIAIDLAAGAETQLLKLPGGRTSGQHRQHGLGRAVAVIVAADLVLSFDNMVAIAAIARGNILFLALGLALSIPLLIGGSAIVAAALRRFTVLILAGGALLGWIAGSMAVTDPIVSAWIRSEAPALLFVVPAFTAAFVVLEIRARRKGVSHMNETQPVRAVTVSPGSVSDTVRPEPSAPTGPAQAMPSAKSPGVAGLLRRASPGKHEAGPEKRRGSANQEGPAYIAPSIEEAAAVGALILVAVSNPMEQGQIARALSRAGYAAVFAADGKRALEQLDARPHGLLLTDCVMPEPDGYAVARQIRAQESRGPETQGGARLAIIGLLGYVTDPNAPQKCRDAGMDDAIAKAVLAINIESLVSRWLPAAAALRRIAGPGETLAAGEAGEQRQRERTGAR